MKNLSIICGIAVLLSLMAVPAFPLSYEFDFNGDEVWDTEWQLSMGETVAVEIWLDGYLIEEDLFVAKLFFQYDPEKIQVNDDPASSYPNDVDHGGPFAKSSFNYLIERTDNLYELGVADFNCVSISNNRILFYTIELECIVDEADVAIKAGSELGFGGYSSGYVANCNFGILYPDDAVCEPATTTSSTTTSVGPTTTSSTPSSTTTSTEPVTSSTTTSTEPVTSSTTSSSSTSTTSTINPTECISDVECDDGIFCNGAESCIDGSCRPGVDSCPAGTECMEETDECREKIPVPTVLTEPDSLHQSRWIPLPLFLNIKGSDTHFDSSSSLVTFSPAGTIWALPLVAHEENILIIGLLMPLWFSPVKSIDVMVATGSEEVSNTIKVELLPFILDQGKDLM